VIVVGILIFAGVSFNTESGEKSNAKDMANTKGGIQNPIVSESPSNNVVYTNNSENNGGNTTVPATTVAPTENSYDMMNITVFAYDPYIASYRYVQGGTVGNAYEITNYADNYTYKESTSTLVYGAQGVKMLSMPNTKITLYGASGSEIASNKTDSDGKCHFNNVLIGVYTMEWSKPAYATTEAKIDLGELVGEGDDPMVISETATKGGVEYLNHYLYYTPTREIYAPLKPTGMQVEITFIASSNTTVENITVPQVQYITEKAKGTNPLGSIPVLGGVSDWALGQITGVEHDLGLIGNQDVVVGTKNITQFRVYLIPRLFSANEMSQIRNIQRQQSMWGWSGIPNQVGLQNSILQNKQQMQSMFNSMWGGLQSVLPYLQSVGGTYTGTTPYGNALTYHSHSVKVLSSYITSFNEIGELSTYVPIVLQKNTMNTISGSQDPNNFELSNNDGSSVLIARPYRFYVVAPKGGDLTIDFEVKVNFVNTTFDISLDNLLHPSVWGQRNETYTFTQSLTWSSAFDPMGAYAYTGTAVDNANSNVLTTPPEDGVETPVEAGVENDLFPLGTSP
jgi:hypothetical protein